MITEETRVVTVAELKAAAKYRVLAALAKLVGFAFQTIAVRALVARQEWQKLALAFEVDNDPDLDECIAEVQS